MIDLSRRVERLEATAAPSRVVVVVVDRLTTESEAPAGAMLVEIVTGVPRGPSWGRIAEAAQND